MFIFILYVGCSRYVLFSGRNERWRNLCAAQAREGAGVGDVGTGLSTTAAATTTGLATSSSLTTTAASTELATTFAATTSLATAVFTATTSASTELATAFTATTAIATSSSGTSLTGRRSQHTVTVELDANLLLAGALTLGLASGSGHEVLLFFLGNGLAFGELGAGALVGLADVLCGKRGLLGLFEKVVGVGLAPVLGLRLGVVLSLGVLLDSLLLLGVGDGLAGLFVSQLSVAVVSAPAVSSLLLVLTREC